jgi:drug/metabolite transporter (DMT)-like permease
MSAPATVAPAADRHLLGITLAVVGVLMFATQDAITKYLVQLYPVPFLVMIRYWAFALFALALARHQSGSMRRVAATNARFVQIARGVILVVEMALMALAFRYLKLAEVHALFASAPLIATALAVPLLGERVGWRRWMAVGAGFLGVLVILRPGLGVFQPANLIAILAAALFAVYVVLTRRVSRTDRSGATLFYTAVVGAAVVSSVGPFYWSSLTPAHWAWLALLCAMGVTGHFLVIKSLEYAPASVLQPFNYLMLVWASVMGFLLFAEVPDLATVIGGAIVVGSGLYVIWRERRLKPAVLPPA